MNERDNLRIYGIVDKKITNIELPKTKNNDTVNNNSSSLTIVMTYLNRKRQLRNTLQSIKQYNDDINIIIIDDSSTDGEDIYCFENDHIKIIRMKNKTWINPSIAFNTGLIQANTDIILMQGAECMHMGNIIEHILVNIKKNVYLSYAALSINKTLTQRLFMGEDIYSIINPHLNDYINGNGGTGWYNHSRYRPEALHFCCAIMREDLHELGGFDERYANGLGYEDNDFVHRIKMKHMDIKIIDNPFVVHQFHEPFNPGPVPTLMAINEPIYNQAISTNQYDVKLHNKIFK
jgi:glycosyltransferase involved in cell wall biosynthesis